MVKNNIFHFLFVFLLLQIIIKADTRKCYVKRPKNDINENDEDNETKLVIPKLSTVVDNNESEVETLGVINSDDENDSDSEYDSYVESISNIYTVEPTYKTITTTITTEESSSTLISSNTEISEGSSVLIQSNTTDDAITTTIDDISATISTADDLTTTVTTTTITTEDVIPTPTQSCIKNSSIKCNDRNTECSLGMDVTEAEIFGSELLKITNTKKIIDTINYLEEKYNKDIKYYCTLSNFTQGMNDYRYRSNERDDDYIKSFEKTKTLVQLYGDIECQPISIEKDDNSNGFASHVKLESDNPVQSKCTLAGEGGVKGYTYSPLISIEVSTFQRVSDDIHIKDGKYNLRNDTKNKNKYTENDLSGCSELWSLNITINDDASMDC